MTIATLGFGTQSDRHTLALEGLVVVVHPVPRLVGIDEGEGERAEPELGGDVDRLAVRARQPHRRMRLLHRLRHQVAARHREVLALEAG